LPRLCGAVSRNHFNPAPDNLAMNVLLADDHLLFREGLRHVLRQFSEHVTFYEAGSYDDIWRLCDSGTPFDLALVDLAMPGWTDFSTLAEVHRRLPRTLLVVVSASEKRSDLLAAIENGASGFIPKSSGAKVLLGALQLVLAGGVYLPEQVIRGDRVAEAGPNGHPAGDDSLLNTLEAGLGGQLTARQLQVLTLLRDGKSNKQIAYELGLTEGTVKVHVTAILRQLGVHNRTQAALTANGLAGDGQ